MNSCSQARAEVAVSQENVSKRTDARAVLQIPFKMAMLDTSIGSLALHLGGAIHRMAANQCTHDLASSRPATTNAATAIKRSHHSRLATITSCRAVSSHSVCHAPQLSYGAKRHTPMQSSSMRWALRGQQVRWRCSANGS